MSGESFSSVLTVYLKACICMYAGICVSYLFSTDGWPLTLTATSRPNNNCPFEAQGPLWPPMGGGSGKRPVMAVRSWDELTGLEEPELGGESPLCLSLGNKKLQNYTWPQQMPLELQTINLQYKLKRGSERERADLRRHLPIWILWRAKSKKTHIFFICIVTSLNFNSFEWPTMKACD